MRIQQPAGAANVAKVGQVLGAYGINIVQVELHTVVQQGTRHAWRNRSGPAVRILPRRSGRLREGSWPAGPGAAPR